MLTETVVVVDVGVMEIYAIDIRFENFDEIYFLPKEYEFI